MELIIGVIIFIVLLTLVGTFLIGFRESKKLKIYEEVGDNASDQLNRSREYESSSLKSNVPILAFIYIVFFLIAIIGLIIYIK